MLQENLKISQFVQNHPILNESETYKKKYINILQYFTNKYSKDDLWSNSIIKLYKNKLLKNTENYIYENIDMKKEIKIINNWKFKKFKIFSYKFCIFIDCLFINAFNNKEKGYEILEEFSNILGTKHLNYIKNIFNKLYDKTSFFEIKFYDMAKSIYEAWEKNKNYLEYNQKNILITANMSAGKSTLLNALIGKKINKTQNEACTAKVHYLINKAYEDNLNYEWDFDLELDATKDMLMNDNCNNESENIFVGTKFRSLFEVSKPICFIDTPGVNYSQDKEHRKITEDVLNNEKYDTIVFLLNGENIGTYDDKIHLKYLNDIFKGNIIFVVNKLDKFNLKEDSIEETLNKVNKDLLELGYDDPKIYPISAHAGYLAKMIMFNEYLDEEALDELERLKRKFKKSEFQFDRYYPNEIRYITKNVPDDEISRVLIHSGILSLETILYNF